jgi:ABC-type phosphate transport system substrate-binding protein
MTSVPTNLPAPTPADRLPDGWALNDGHGTRTWRCERHRVHIQVIHRADRSGTTVRLVRFLDHPDGDGDRVYEQTVMDGDTDALHVAVAGLAAMAPRLAGSD